MTFDKKYMIMKFTTLQSNIPSQAYCTFELTKTSDSCFYVNILARYINGKSEEFNASKDIEFPKYTGDLIVFSSDDLEEVKERLLLEIL